MVPVEFWSYLNSSIKVANPEALTIAEVYNPTMYRDFINLGKMDYLYDKVDFYDTLKGIMQGKVAANELLEAQAKVLDIEQYMIHFLENHDEQRIASPDFVGDANIAKPAMAVSTLISRAPTMIYFGQDVGESGALNSGFGTASRTSIFDYAGVPAHQRWMNEGAFDGGQSTEKEKALMAFYSRLMKLSTMPAIANGDYAPLSLSSASHDTKSLLAFARWTKGEKVIVLNQFSNEKASLSVVISGNVVEKWQLEDGSYPLKELLSENSEKLDTNIKLDIVDGIGHLNMKVAPLAALVFVVQVP
jgi:glycosidase